MDKEKKLEVLKNSAVQAHISMLQGIINRMAGNSANCKNWTVTLVAAMLVLLVDKDMQIPNAWICLIPVALFYLFHLKKPFWRESTIMKNMWRTYIRWRNL